MKHFLTDMSNRVKHQKLNQVAAERPPGWVFVLQLGLQETLALIKMKTIRRGKVPLAVLLNSSNLLPSSNVDSDTFPLLIVLILISACVCRRPSSTPKTQPGDSSAATWLSFWCSTRLLMSVKKCLIYRGKTCRCVQWIEANTKNSTNRPHKWALWLSFWCRSRPPTDTDTNYKLWHHRHP